MFESTFIIGKNQYEKAYELFSDQSGQQTVDASGISYCHQFIDMRWFPVCKKKKAGKGEKREKGEKKRGGERKKGQIFFCLISFFPFVFYRFLLSLLLLEEMSKLALGLLVMLSLLGPLMELVTFLSLRFIFIL